MQQKTYNEDDFEKYLNKLKKEVKGYVKFGSLKEKIDGRDIILILKPDRLIVMAHYDVEYLAEIGFPDNFMLANLCIELSKNKELNDVVMKYLEEKERKKGENDGNEE